MCLETKDLTDFTNCQDFSCHATLSETQNGFTAASGIGMATNV